MFEGVERETVVGGWIASAFSISVLFLGAFTGSMLQSILLVHTDFKLDQLNYIS